MHNTTTSPPTKHLTINDTPRSTHQSPLKVSRETTYRTPVHDFIRTPMTHNTPGPTFESNTPTSTRPLTPRRSNRSRKAPTRFGYDGTQGNGYVAEVAES
jgi:hypothetical protein